MTPDALRADGWTVVEEDGFLNLIGPVWQRIEGRGVALGVLADAKHRNRSGNVQGGMLAALVDRALGMAARLDEPARAQSTIQLSLQYLDFARVGEFLTARGHVLRQTTTLAFMAGEITAGDRPVAHATGIWRIRPGIRAEHSRDWSR